MHVLRIQVFTVLGHHGALRPGRDGGQAFVQSRAHGHKAFAAAVKPVGNARSHGAQRLVSHRHHRIQVFRPEVQHVGGERHAVQLCVHDGGQHHQHGAGFVAEHGVIFPSVQARQIEQRRNGEGNIIEEDAQGGVAPAAYFARAEDLHAGMALAPGAGITVPLKPLAFWIVGQAAQYIHLTAVFRKARADVGDGSPQECVCLSRKNSFFQCSGVGKRRQSINPCAIPFCLQRPHSSG